MCIRISLLTLSLLVLSVLGTRAAFCSHKLVMEGSPIDLQTITELKRSDAHVSGMDATSRLRDFLTAHGYLDAEVVLRGDSLVVRAGERYAWGTFLILETDIALHPSGAFTEHSLRSTIAGLLDSLDRVGYRFAQLNLEEVRREENRVTVLASLNSGPVVRLGAVWSTPPLERTDDSLFARYFSPYVGQPATQGMIEELTLSARQIPFLELSDDAKLLPRPGYEIADLVLPMAERAPLRAEGTIGSRSGDRAPLIWRVKGEAINVFGDGRRGMVESEKSASGQVLAFRYNQPLFWFGRDDMEVSVVSRDDRDRFYEFAGEFAYLSSIARHLRMRTAFSYRTVTAALPEEGEYRTGRISAGLERTPLLVRAKRRTGVSWLGELTTQYRSLSVPDSQSEKGKSLIEAHLRGEIETTMYFQQAFALFLRIGGRSFESRTALPPLAELPRTGGEGTVRGWARESLASIRAGHGTIEPRVYFSAGYLFAFYDAAYLYDRIERIPEIVRGRYRYVDGFGAGLSMSGARYGVTVSFSWARDIPFDTPRVDISLFSHI